MARLRIPRLRWWGWLAVAAGLLLVYLVALSTIPALLANDEPRRASRTRARDAIETENWSLVTPEDREELALAIDQAWRDLTAYRFAYRAGTAEQLTANQPVAVAESIFNLGTDGRIREQRDSNFTSAQAPGSDGRDQRFEGFRILTDRPYVNQRGSKVGDAELIYQRVGGVWSCMRVLADKNPIAPPGLQLDEGGDGGFAEADGRRVRRFILPAGAFGLRSPATVWVDVESLLVRGQEIESVVRGQREVWTYGGFDERAEITPPPGIACNDG